MTIRILIPVCFILMCILSNYSNSEEVTESKLELSKLLEQYKGQVIYLDFWASWCIPCKKSFPWMNKTQETYHLSGFTIIGINLDSDKTEADEFLDKLPAKFPIIFDPKGDIASHFNIPGMPSSILINREGKIVKTHSGFFANKIQIYESEIVLLLESNQEENKVKL